LNSGLTKGLEHAAIAGASALLVFYPAPLALKIALAVLILALYLRASSIAPAPDTDADWSLQPNTVPGAIIISDLNGKLLFANEAATSLFPTFRSGEKIADLFGVWHQGALSREPLDQVVAAAQAAPDFRFAETLHFQDGKVFERLTRVAPGDSKRIWVIRDISHLQQATHDSEMHATMVEADAARTAELAEQLYHAKSELEAKQAELTRLANTDSLTSLYNRRRFTALGEKSVKTASQESIFVLMMDIDHFKRINDTYGHAAGDIAIRDFAAIAETEVGETGFLGRMGGEEFAAILTDTNLDTAIKIAEAIRHNTAGQITQYEAEKFRFTISIGVASWFKDEVTIEAALDRADRALYSAKSYGRNRVVGFEMAEVE